MTQPRTPTSKDEANMAMARAAASRSKDPSTQVGAVIVTPDGRSITAGYNGAPIGWDDADFPWGREVPDGGTELDTKYPFVIHAERNAVLQFAGDRTRLQGSTIYVTHAPCSDCMKELAQVGVSRVVYQEDHAMPGGASSAASRIIAEKCGISVERLGRGLPPLPFPHWREEAWRRAVQGYARIAYQDQALVFEDLPEDVLAKAEGDVEELAGWLLEETALPLADGEDRSSLLGSLAWRLYDLCRPSGGPPLRTIERSDFAKLHGRYFIGTPERTVITDFVRRARIVVDVLGDPKALGEDRLLLLDGLSDAPDEVLAFARKAQAQALKVLREHDDGRNGCACPACQDARALLGWR